MSAPHAIANLPGMPGRTRVAAYPADALSSDIATARTIDAMRRAVAADAGSAPLAQAAQQIRATLPAQPTRRQIADAVFAYVKRTVRFERDDVLAAALGANPEDEIVIHPARLLTMPAPAGDCDDFSTLGAALLGELGVPASFVTIKADPNRPREWSHVYLAAGLESGERLPLDISHGEAPGWEYPHALERRAWPLNAPAGGVDRRGVHARLNGLAAIGLNIPTGSSWGDVLRTGATTGFQIALDRFSTPRGLFQQTNADGSSVTFRQPDGASSFSFPTTQLSAPISGNLLMLGGLALMAVLVIGAAKR